MRANFQKGLSFSGVLSGRPYSLLVKATIAVQHPLVALGQEVTVKRRS